MAVAHLLLLVHVLLVSSGVLAGVQPMVQASAAGLAVPWPRSLMQVRGDLSLVVQNLLPQQQSRGFSGKQLAGAPAGMLKFATFQLP